MTDFLSSLSERAAGQASVLERRRPSLFEPVTGSAPLDQKKDDAAIRETAVEVVAANPPSVQRTARQEPPADSNAIDKLRSARNASRDTIREENSPGHPRTVSENKVNRRADESPSKPIVEKRAEEAPREELRPSLRDRQTSVGPPGVRSQLRVLEIRTEREVVVAPPKASDARVETNDKATEVSPQPQPSILRPVVQPARTKPDVETKIETRVEKEIAVAPRNDLKSPNTRLAQFAVPRVQSRRAQAPKLNAQPVPPSIQVTIGRVEVRATAAAPAKRETPSARPTLSLEDYLRARSGESR